MSFINYIQFIYIRIHVKKINNEIWLVLSVDFLDVNFILKSVSLTFYVSCSINQIITSHKILKMLDLVRRFINHPGMNVQCVLI